MTELTCLLVQAMTARLGRDRGASSDFFLCSSTARHSKLCPLLCPVLSSSSCPHPIGLQSIALLVLIKQKTIAFCRQASLAYLIYRHFYPPAREIRSTTLLPSCRISSIGRKMNSLFIILEALHRCIQLLCHKEREGNLFLINRLNLPFFLCQEGWANH
uniref:hypothetical protein n=1 Tax=Bidens bipinnata TaxID=1527831 RepID=UPI001EDE0D67|nr:hypothetical protein MFQ52_mgp20 [Bidens bipinnata]YP_010352615.1 hypothetical protein MFQ53_mgp10 [Bidens parviflora]YP_010352723.1 hypothetical protein MFU86_mgp20 [Bidens biternata]YP_010352766.1 hypothetical protein MZG22_mgp38 [Bidens pilosa]UIR99397.1 hypothetical protein [Bidens alba var. radiata]UIR98968.1 hypothetical protein [Bidens parviflora]UIR99077.1 hypothetical protein [Bidens bipinnata]UIR99140.1 hypothetical protein [Bidens biternata]UIR99202.1 hypothetical protein [Bid